MDTWQDKVITHEAPHARPENLDPKKNGPFLDDIRREQEKAYREARVKASKEQIKREKEAAKNKKDKEPTPVTAEQVLNDQREEEQRKFTEKVQKAAKK